MEVSLSALSLRPESPIHLSITRDISSISESVVYEHRYHHCDHNRHVVPNISVYKSFLCKYNV